MIGVSETAYVHPTAVVESDASIGEGTKIWHGAQIRTRARVGRRCMVGKGVFVDFDVVIGDDTKLQNYACVYHGTSLGRGVFVGPHAVFTNDLRPRSTSPEFELLRDGDWECGEIRVGDGASIGANATVLPGVWIGAWSMVAAASVVTRNVEAYALVIGSPARRVGWLCRCGRKVTARTCSRCGTLPEDHPLVKHAP